MSMIGKFYGGTIGKGFKNLGKGLATGSLSNPKVWKGMGLISLGLLGTSSMFRAINGNRERMRRRTMTPREKFNMRG